jgi:hypothetical protein
VNGIRVIGILVQNLPVEQFRLIEFPLTVKLNRVVEVFDHECLREPWRGSQREQTAHPITRSGGWREDVLEMLFKASRPGGTSPNRGGSASWNLGNPGEWRGFAPPLSTETESGAGNCDPADE